MIKELNKCIEDLDCKYYNNFGDCILCGQTINNEQKIREQAIFEIMWNGEPDSENKDEISTIHYKEAMRNFFKSIKHKE